MENAALRRAPVWTAMAAIVAASWWALTTMSGGTMTYGAVERRRPRHRGGLAWPALLRRLNRLDPGYLC